MSSVRSGAWSVLVVLLLVASACTGESSEAVSVAGSTAPTSDVGDDVPDEIAQILDAELAAMPQVSVEPDSVAPGATVEVSGLEGAVGALRVYGPEGVVVDQPVTGSSASVAIAPDAPPGEYLVVVESADGFPAAASFKVSGGPFLTLAIDGDGLVATADGVPLDTPARILVGSGASAQFLEAGPGGLLLLLSRPPEAVLADYLGVRLEIPPTVEGKMTLVAAEGEDSGVSSNSVLAQRCDAAPMLTGDLGGPGEVRAVWMGSDPGAAATGTETGPYRIEVGPGTVVVMEYPSEGEAQSVVVTATCGRETSVNDAGGSAAYSPGGLGDDSWIGAVTVDSETTTVDEGLALCTDDGGSLEISLFDDLDFTIGLNTTIDGYAGDGTYVVPGFFFDDAGTFADATFSFEIAESSDGTLTGTFTGNAEAAVEFDGAFRCGFVNFQGLEAPQGVLASYGAGSAHEPCRIGLVSVPEVGSEVALILARRMAEGLPLITWYTTGDVAGLLDAAAQEQGQKRDGTALIEQARRIISADYRVFVTLREASQSYEDQRWWALTTALDVERTVIVARMADSGPDIASLRTLPKSGRFITQLGQAGICGYAEPSEATIGPSETQQFSYDVVDLIDKPVFDAQVSVIDRKDGSFAPDCGSFDRVEGTSSDFTTTFTAADEVGQDCTEYPRFSAKSGDLRTRPEREPRADATVHVGSKWEYEVTMVMPDFVGPFTWRIGTSDEPGVFYVRESGAIVGGATGSIEGTRSCRVYENDQMTYQEPPTPVSGTWTSWLGGSLVDDQTGRFFRFTFDGSGWSSSWPPLPAECGGEALSFGEEILRFIGYHIDGVTFSRIQLPVEATTATFPVDPEVLPNAQFVISIRPAAPNPGD